MGENQKSGYSLPLIYLTNDNASRSSQTTPYFDLITINDGSTDYSPDIIDLSDDDNQLDTPDIPVIDLTGDDDHFLNDGIPVIDLTDDDIQDITNQTQCIDLTNNDASNRNHTIQNFDIGKFHDSGTNSSSKLTDLTLDDIQDFNADTPVIDLSCDDDQFLNFRIGCNDATNDDLQHITHQLHNFDLTDSKQQSRNDYIPPIDLRKHSIDRIIPITDMTSEKDYNNDSRQIIDSIRNYDRVIRKPVNDVEIYNFSCNNSNTSLQTGVIENNLRTPAANLSDIASENDSLKYNEIANKNSVNTNTFSKFHRKRENLSNHPLKNFECIQKRSWTSHLPRKNHEEKFETNLTNQPIRNNFEDGKETIWTNHSLRSNSEEKYLSQRKSEKIFLNDAEDFMKPARYPIPLRHSLGRSTVNTSKNIPIEFTEASEDESRILTASSIIRRKKSKLDTDISKKNLPKSKKPSTSKESAFSFETSKRIFPPFWIILLFTFIALYYWL